MPVVTAPPAAAPTIESQLITADGKLSVTGQVIEAFLATLDWSPILDDAELKECIEVLKTRARFYDESELAVEAKGDDKDEKDEKGGKDKKDDEEEGDDEEEEEEDDKEVDEADADVEILQGEVAAELVDEKDLGEMFMAYVHGLPEDTLAGKVAKASMVKCFEMDAAALVEFNRGDFVKARKTAPGKNKVTRMLMAMLAKQAIARAKPGQGKYSAPGASAPTYTKAGVSGQADNLNTTGKASYGKGTPAGIKKYYSFVGKNAGKSASGEAKSGTKSRKSAAEIAKAARSKASGGKQFKVAAKGGDEKKTAKIAALAKKKPGVVTKTRKSLTASHDTPPANMTEAVLAGQMLGRMVNARRVDLVETAAPAKK
jgi:hypothetical protein